MTVECGLLMFCCSGGKGNWSSNGCTTVDDGSGVIKCNCTHLTNFGLLVVRISIVVREGALI